MADSKFLCGNMVHKGIIVTQSRFVTDKDVVTNQIIRSVKPNLFCEKMNREINNVVCGLCSNFSKKVKTPSEELNSIITSVGEINDSLTVTN